MHPVLKRILLHGGMTALVLAAIGLLFAELASMWMSGGEPRPGAPEAPPVVPEGLRVRVPFMMAFWGFVFVAGCELVMSRFRKPVKPLEKPTDDAERLLNELLAQAESKMALEAGSREPEDGERKTESGGQKAE